MRKIFTLMLTALMAGSITMSAYKPDAGSLGGSHTFAGEKPLGKLVLSDDPREMSLIKRIPEKGVPEGAHLAPTDYLFKTYDNIRQATPAQRAVAATLRLEGQSGYSVGLEQKMFYHIPTNQSDEFEIFCSTAPYHYNYGHVYNPDGTYVGFIASISGSTYNGGYIDKIDLATGELLSSTEVPFDKLKIMAYSCARDPQSGLVYGYFYNSGDGIMFGTVDFENMERTDIKKVTSATALSVLAASESGEFYGITTTGDLMKLDKTTGETSFIGHVDYPNTYSHEGVINSRNNTMLVLTVADDQLSSSLYEIDLTSAAITEIATYPPTIFGSLRLISSGIGDHVPSAPALTANAPEGNMTVNLTITLPSTLADDTPATGTLHWEIKLDGAKQLEGTAQPGATVEKTLDVAETGWHEITATASNDDGISPETKLRLFVGKGLPGAPANVAASWADGNMTITWDAVTESADGGYINPAEVTYDVTDADGRNVATALTATSLTIPVAMPQSRTDFQYAVVASYNGTASAAGLSNTVHVGDWTAPYYSNLSASSTVMEDEGYTVIDVNGDGKTWSNVAGAGARYTYSPSNAADDWLISPAVRLEAGKNYYLTIMVYTGNYNERIEIKMGRDKTIEAMTTTLAEPTVVKCGKTDAKEFRNLISPESDGLYYFGMHAISDADMYYLYVLSLEVSAPLTANSPHAPANLTLTPAFNGDLNMTGEFTAPSTTILDTPVTGDVTFEIFRDGTLIDTKTAAAGAKVTFADEVETKAVYTYKVSASCGDSKGLSTEGSVEIGPKIPANVTDVHMVESYQPGTVTIFWSPVTTSQANEPIDNSYVRYMIYGYDENDEFTVPMLDEPTADCFATFKALDNVDVQKFVNFKIFTLNRGETSSGQVTGSYAVGPAYQLPLQYSKPTDHDDHIISIGRSVYGDMYGLHWTTISWQKDEDNEDYDAFDNDGYHYSIKYPFRSMYASFTTGNFDLTKSAHPEVSYAVRKDQEMYYGQYDAYIEYDGKRDLLGSTNLVGEPDGWVKIRYSLEAYKGKNVNFYLVTSDPSNPANKTFYSYAHLDAISIKETPDKDLWAKRIEAPSAVNVNEEFNVSVTVMNQGFEDAANFSVELYRDGKLIATRTVAALEADEQITVLFANLISHFDDTPTEATYTARVIFEGDKDNSNNSTGAAKVIRRISKLNTVTDLTGEITDEGTRLTWTPYSTDNLVASEITDDFESYDTGATEIDGWTFIDVDGNPSAGLGSFEVPGMKDGDSMAFAVVNSTGLGSKYAANSGLQYLGSAYSADGDDVDDWAVSPKLSGERQTISFYAKSYHSRYRESFQVLYTTANSLDPEDYTLLDDVADVPNAWTRYEYELPQGTLHFAIRSYADDQMYFFVDDVTFTPDRLYGSLTLLGYDVYRNGEKINNALVTGNTFIDTAMPQGEHSYHVIASYAEGQSEKSNEAKVGSSALTSVFAGGNAQVSAVDGEIVITGAAGERTSIITADGRTLYTGAGDARVPVQPAVYLVTVGKSTFKLIVR